MCIHGYLAQQGFHGEFKWGRGIKIGRRALAIGLVPESTRYPEHLFLDPIRWIHSSRTKQIFTHISFVIFNGRNRCGPETFVTPVHGTFMTEFGEQLVKKLFIRP